MLQIAIVTGSGVSKGDRGASPEFPVNDMANPCIARAQRGGGVTNPFPRFFYHAGDNVVETDVQMRPLNALFLVLLGNRNATRKQMS